MNDSRTILNSLIVLILVMLLVVYALDIKVPYPPYVINAFSQPIVRLLVYIGMYSIAYYNPVVSILTFVCVISLHLDLINLGSKNKNTQ